MWQVAVTAAAAAAAAVAGSGFIAKQIFSTKTTQTDPNKLHQLPNNLPETFRNASDQLNCDEEEEGVFWFSSSGSSGKRTGSRSKSKAKRFPWKSEGGSKKNVSGSGNGSVDQRKSCGKKVTVCLKKRRTCRHSSGKGDLSCSKDCSSFSCGLGLGIIYMMSTGKAEISKLSSAVDETAKVVNELKSEFEKRQVSHSQQLLNFSDTVNSEDSIHKLATKQATSVSCKLNDGPINLKFVNHLADSEYASSVLTEEQQSEGAEMDELQAELESELQKLPWLISETSQDKEKIASLPQIERHEYLNQSSSTYQSGGVSPATLKDKLSRVLVIQQESQIMDLESELNLAYSKLQEKEIELRALKDCVRRLTEFSLTSVSDEETEACVVREQCGEYDKTKGASDGIVGMKRAMHF